MVDTNRLYVKRKSSGVRERPWQKKSSFPIKKLGNLFQDTKIDRKLDELSQSMMSSVDQMRFNKDFELRKL